jgi:hypothetical protein
MNESFPGELIRPCRYCGRAKRIDAWCGSEECAVRIAAIRAELSAERNSFLAAPDSPRAVSEGPGIPATPPQPVCGCVGRREPATETLARAYVEACAERDRQARAVAAMSEFLAGWCPRGFAAVFDVRDRALAGE